MASYHLESEGWSPGSGHRGSVHGGQGTELPPGLRPASSYPAAFALAVFPPGRPLLRGRPAACCPSCGSPLTYPYRRCLPDHPLQGTLLPVPALFSSVAPGTSDCASPHCLVYCLRPLWSIAPSRKALPCWRHCLEQVGVQSRPGKRAERMSDEPRGAVP